MVLPGRLRATSLGDLLGMLHRARATGALEIVDKGERCHRIHLSRGEVLAVEFDGATPSLAELLRRTFAADEATLRRSLLRALSSQRLHGDVLVRDFQLPAHVVDEALRRQLEVRLDALDRLLDAQLHFRVATRPPRGALFEKPLGPPEFLHGRRRFRDRAGDRRTIPHETLRTSAWRTLGLSPGASEENIKRAYRRVVRTCHPDLHPHAALDEKRRLEAKLHAATEAYRTLLE